MAPVSAPALRRPRAERPVTGESDGGLPPDHVVEDRDAILASTESVIARLGTDLPEPLDGFALGPERHVRHLVVDGHVVLSTGR